MNVHISYRLHKTPAVEKDIQHQIEKLRKRLQVFRPELVHLKGMVEEVSAREGTSVSLNLRLPSGQMAAQTTATTAAAAVKTAFEDLLQQVNKHKELLRSTHKWTRRAEGCFGAPQCLRALRANSGCGISGNGFVRGRPLLRQRESFSPRTLCGAGNLFPRASDQVVPDSISKEEVIDETIAAASAMARRNRSALALEPWLYRLALDALDELSRPEETDGGAVRLEQSARKPNVRASDEPELQFHQPDESITEETIIADDRVATPEQIVGSDEMIRLIASALRDVRRPSRGLYSARRRRLRGGRNLRHHRHSAGPGIELHFCRARSLAQIAPVSLANSRDDSPILAPRKFYSKKKE